MAYLYHSVPLNLQGSVLYPLNSLKDKYPKIYEEQIKKYAGREHITEQRIPVLDCLWNDVLHFSAVHPGEIKHALVEAGRDSDFVMNFYQIDPAFLDPRNTVVYLFAHADDEEKMSEGNFAPYNPGEMEMVRFSVMPERTKEYYKEMIKRNERPLLYHRIPHILYKGTLDVTGLPIVSV